jgi:hypothetical protein
MSETTSKAAADHKPTRRVGTICGRVSTSALTSWAVIVAGISILLIVAIDYRRPASRRRITERAYLPGRAPAVQDVVQLPVKRYKGTPIWQRFLSVVGLGAMSAFLGLALAVGMGLLVIGLFWLLNGAVK